MKPLIIQRYPPKNELLKFLMKYFWVMRSENPVRINHKLLPVTNIDIVLNFSSTMKYISKDSESTVPQYSFSGIKSQHYLMSQTGRLNLIGASFYPTGLFPVLKRSLAEFADQTIDLTSLIPEFNSRLEIGFNPEGSIPSQIEQLEKIFASLIDPQFILNREIIRIFESFNTSSDKMSITEYCEAYGLNPRKLQRVFQKYIGINPKSFKRIKRFQGVIRALLSRTPIDLTSIAYDHVYYDQAHFINDFKSFSGCSPSNYLREKKSLKQILIYK